MLLEERRVRIADLSSPPHFARTFAVRGGDSEQVLGRMRDAWGVMAALGRWCDDELGEWPNNEEVVSMMPPWLSGEMRDWPDFEVENFLDALHDRSWIWWCAMVVDGEARVVIDCESLPISWWPLRAVALAAGATAVEELIV